jgi:hypothetical protein
VTGSYYTKPGPELAFGDIFKALYLFDVHLRTDADQMGSRQLRAGMGYSPQFKTREDFVLAHGRRCDAVLISENCSIDDALGVDRQRAKPRGRLLFAPVSPQQETEITHLDQNRAFDRFPLIPRDGYVGGIVELRRLFMVDIRDVEKSNRMVSLAARPAEELAVTLSAYTTRHGPLTALHHADKLAQLLAKGTDPDNRTRTAALRVAQVIADAWTLDGLDLSAAAEVVIADEVPSILSSIVSRLRSLAETAAAAADALADLQPTS